MVSFETDFRWLSEHPRERIELYRGQWLAIVENHVIASGADADSVYQKARLQHPHGDILLDHVERDITNPIYECVSLA
jgi:hypothetical protein